MLDHLDLLQAEHNEKIDGLKESLTSKETVIKALGKELAEFTKKSSLLGSEQKVILSEIKAITRKYELSTKELTSLRLSSEVKLQEMKKLVENEKQLRAVACEEVMNETISAAEKQFNEANVHYMTLKQKYNIKVAMVSKLEKDVKLVQRQLNNEKEARASEQAKLTVDVAQLRAAVANVEVKAAEKIKEFQINAKELNKMHRNAQKELEKATLSREEMIQKLELVTSEKERLARENLELSVVCEEMMIIVESDASKVASG